MLEFMKLYADMEQLFEPYSMEERGRLFTAMMSYAFDGVEPEFTGNERFIWPVLRRHFDQCASVNEKNAINGSKGGRPRNQPKPTATENNPAKPKETQINPVKPRKTLQEQEHIQEQEHKQEHIQKQEQNQKPETGIVLGFDGTDLTKDIKRNDLADNLIITFNLNRDNPTREALLNDLEFYGEKRMREVLEKACQSNSRERVTVNYWRAILQGRGKDAKGPNAGMMNRNAEYQNNPDFWKSLETDIDAM